MQKYSKFNLNLLQFLNLKFNFFSEIIKDLITRILNELNKYWKKIIAYAMDVFFFFFLIVFTIGIIFFTNNKYIFSGIYTYNFK